MTDALGRLSTRATTALRVFLTLLVVDITSPEKTIEALKDEAGGRQDSGEEVLHHRPEARHDDSN